MKPVTQVCEIALVTQAIHNTVTSLESQGEHVAYILCGDFNIEPEYPAYEILKEGRLNDEQFCKLQSVEYLKFPADVEKPKQVYAGLLNKTERCLVHKRLSQFIVSLNELFNKLVIIGQIFFQVSIAMHHRK